MEVLAALSEAGTTRSYLKPFLIQHDLAKFEAYPKDPEPRTLFRAERLGISIPHHAIMPHLLKNDAFAGITAYALESPRITSTMLEEHMKSIFMSPAKENSIIEGLRQVFSDPLNSIAVDSPLWEKATLMINTIMKIRARSKDVEKNILAVPNLPDQLILAIPALLDSKLSCDLGL